MKENNIQERVGVNSKYNPSQSLISKIFNKLSCFGWNIATCIINIFVHRNNAIVLIGAWGGSKFADNSRFLYQYLFHNKKELGLKKVIWVTRSNKVYDELSRVGYESYVCGTRESRYYHLKAGIHVICNSAAYGFLMPDIDTKYSYGAKKIQLWHGVGFKAVGPASNKEINKIEKQDFKRKYARFYQIFTYGGWISAFFLSTSEKNAEAIYRISETPKGKIFISGYPRNCECIRLLPEEEKVIEKIKKYPGAILYLPTFRETSSYVHPLEYDSVCKLIKDNGWLWIEKPHSADTDREKFKERDCDILELDSDFDINVIYRYIKGLVSDYSSAVFDGAYKGIPTVMYTPDIDEFKSGSIGFLFDVESYCKSLICKDEQTLYEDIKQIILGSYLNQERSETLYKIRRDYFDDRDSSYEDIWNDILKVISKNH